MKISRRFYVNKEISAYLIGKDAGEIIKEATDQKLYDFGQVPAGEELIVVLLDKKLNDELISTGNDLMYSQDALISKLIQGHMNRAMEVDEKKIIRECILNALEGGSTIKHIVNNCDCFPPDRVKSMILNMILDKTIELDADRTLRKLI